MKRGLDEGRKKISTTRPPFRVGYRRRSSTTPASTATTKSTIDGTSTTSPLRTLTKRRKPAISGSSSAAVESQDTTTPSPPRFTNRFKFVSRKPYLRTTLPKNLTINTTDQTIESTNQQSLEGVNTTSTEPSDLADIAAALQKIQQAPVPQAKPSRKRPQILPPNAQYSTTTTRKPPTKTTTATEISFTKTRRIPQNYNKKTVAITAPFMRGTYIASQKPQSLTADRYVSNIAITTPLAGKLEPINAQEYVSRYTPSVSTSTRAKSRFSITEAPSVVITPGQPITSHRRKPTRPFQKVLSRAEDQNTYKPLVTDYDYYDNIETSIFGKIPEHSKVLLHSNGIIECLDQGNFPHPVSCKKFIYCAKMDNDKIIGWEYTCPKNLSFDPIGGMCNWSAGLGCNET